MKKFFERIFKHWQTSIIGIVLVIGFELLRSDKINVEDFREYLALIPVIIGFLMKDWGKKDESK